MTKPVRFLSYNIRKAVGLDGRRRPGRILDVINRTDADVVLLQEADKRLGNRPAALGHRLIEDFSDYDVVPLSPNEVSLGWHGNAILVRRGMTVHRTERLALPGLEPRGAVMAQLSTGDSAPVTIIGVHLALLRPWRRLQLAAITQALGAWNEARSVIAGDFNEWSPDKGMEALAGTHSIISPGKSFHANRPLATLDKIAHGGDIEAMDAGVEETAAARISSDHLPVWADLRLPSLKRAHPDAGTARPAS
jgi:endonuclease/exonuclease/phosphatase family metal-dependent hydrolase